MLIFPSSLQTPSLGGGGGGGISHSSYEHLQDNFHTSNHYIHLRNEERVDQVFARDFCISALPAPGCGMVVTTMQRCSALRRVSGRHFGIQTCLIVEVQRLM